MKYFVIFALSVFLFSSCVTLKKYNALKTELDQCNTNKKATDKQLRELTDIANQCGSSLNQLKQEVRNLKSDTASLGQAKRDCESSTYAISQRMSELQTSSDKYAQLTNKEMKALLLAIQQNQEALIQKQDSVNQLIKALDEKQKNLYAAEAHLKNQEVRMKQLEKVLSERDSMVLALRRSVSDALVGFVGNGLSVNIKNGQVYVSMDESLLFKSASWQVSPKGVDALKKIGRILEQQSDINVIVEGHTDNVPFNGPGQVRDNWDLSVMRATSVTKILLQNTSITPGRITSAGRGEYLPVDPVNSMEARAKNRRTEVILTPKLDQLMKIIGNTK